MLSPASCRISHWCLATVAKVLKTDILYSKIGTNVKSVLPQHVESFNGQIASFLSQKGLIKVKYNVDL